METYYPTYNLGCNPIHEVKDWCYVRKLIRAARKGEKINPILIDGQKGNGNLLAGTHRAAANDIMDMLGEDNLIEFISIDDLEEGQEKEELIEAAQECDYERIDSIWDRK